MKSYAENFKRCYVIVLCSDEVTIELGRVDTSKDTL